MRYLIILILACSCTRPHDEDDIAFEHTLPMPSQQTEKAFMQNKVSRVLYMIQAKKTEQAIDQLLALKAEDPYLFHEGTLEKLGFALFEQGMRSFELQDVVTCLYGIGIAHDERGLPIVAKAIQFDHPELQLLAVSVAASFDTELAFEIIERAMKSNYLFVRLEAAYLLAQKGSPTAYSQLVSLMAKVEPELHELFPRLFAMCQSEASSQELKRLLYDQNESVRREAILAMGELRRDDFCDDIRLLAKEPSTVQQEACAYTLGLFRDEASRATLETLARSHTLATKLAASIALYHLGSQEAKNAVIQAAYDGDLFAISALGSLQGDEVLIKHLNHDDVNIRTNASIALLEVKDSRCLQGIADILLDSHRDYTIAPIMSHGGSLRAWKVTSSSSVSLENQPQFFEISLKVREQILIKALDLPEHAFLDLAEELLDNSQYDLIPLTVRLLENLRSEKAIALLKKYEMRLGKPYVRAWCALGLYRLHQEGPYAETILKFVAKHEDKEVFKARPVLPWRLRPETSPYELTLEDSCRLLIESFEALAQAQDEKGIETLLRVIRDGNAHNRYTLAGLLIRSSL